MSHHTFVGTCSRTLELDDTEYADMTVPQITAEIMKTLSEIAPDVTFWDQDIAMAAVEIASKTWELTLDEKFDKSDVAE